jgi:hypothetical protein
MTIWFLVMWSATVSPFDAGQYQSVERCEMAAKMQVVGLRHLSTTPLQYKCQARTELL